MMQLSSCPRKLITFYFQGGNSVEVPFDNSINIYSLYRLKRMKILEEQYSKMKAQRTQILRWEIFCWVTLMLFYSWQDELSRKYQGFLRAVFFSLIYWLSISRNGCGWLASICRQDNVSFNVNQLYLTLSMRPVCQCSTITQS